MAAAQLGGVGLALAPPSVIISKLAACVNFLWLYKLPGVRGRQWSEANEGSWEA